MDNLAFQNLTGEPGPPLFVSNEVDVSALKEMTDADLLELGIRNNKHFEGSCELLSKHSNVMSISVISQL